MRKFQSAPAASGSAKKGGADASAFQDFWQAPARYWKRDLADWEIDLVQVRLAAF